MRYLRFLPSEFLAAGQKKGHNITVLRYHIVFPAKYRRTVLDEQVDDALQNVSLEIEDRCQLKFLEIGTDKDHVHFMVQLVPTYTVTKLVTVIKSITSREIFRLCPDVKKQLWAGSFGAMVTLRPAWAVMVMRIQ